MNKETKRVREIWAGIKNAAILFRVHTGRAWAGKRIDNGESDIAHILGARIITLGLGLINGKPLNGTSDLIGFTPIKITPEMVGQTIAVFTAIEVKEPDEKPRKDQIDFINIIKSSGGLAGSAETVEDALKILRAKT